MSSMDYSHARRTEPSRTHRYTLLHLEVPGMVGIESARPEIPADNFQIPTRSSVYVLTVQRF